MTHIVSGTEVLHSHQRISSIIVRHEIAQAVLRLQQLANVAAKGDVPAVARVDLRTWRVTLETSDVEQERILAPKPEQA